MDGKNNECEENYALETSDELDDSDFRYKVPRKCEISVYLDLHFSVAVKDEDHSSPYASPESLEEISNQFLKSLELKAKPKKRKLFTPNYDDQIPFEEDERNKLEVPIMESKEVKLRVPIPRYLIPSEFLTTTPTKTSEFLESLDGKITQISTIPLVLLNFL